MKMQQHFRSFCCSEYRTINYFKVKEFKYFYSLDSAKCIVLVYKVKAKPKLYNTKNLHEFAYLWKVTERFIFRNISLLSQIIISVSHLAGWSLVLIHILYCYNIGNNYYTSNCNSINLNLCKRYTKLVHNISFSYI